MLHSRRSTYILSFLLLASLAGSVFLALLLRHQYRQTVRVQLDPTAAAKFTKLNADLPPPQPGEKRVVFFGTSHIELWQKLPAVTGCQLVNRGQSYDTSEQLRLRLERDVLALKPDIVFFEGGTNDLKAIGVLPGEEAAIVERLKANRAAMIERLTAAGIQVIVATIFPFGDVGLTRLPVWSDRSLEVREEMNREIRESQGPLITVFDADVVLAEKGRMKGEYQLDWLHVNPAGYEALSRAAAPFIEACRKRK